MIDFVILHYQAIDETKDCIETIDKMVTGEKRIVVVDNCSPNGSGEELAQLYEHSNLVTVIMTRENLGFAKGNNIGFIEAKKNNPDFIVVMNNDVFIQQGDFTELVYESYNKYNFAIMGPDIYSTKVNGHQNPQRMKNYTLEELKYAKKKLQFKIHHKWILKIKYVLPFHKQKEKGAAFVDHELENVVLHGACYVFSKDFIRSHDECFYNETFMYYESYILHYLAQKEGLKIIYEPTIRVLHHEDVATNQTYGKMYQKAVFVNKCQLDSCKIFLKLVCERN